MAKQTFFVDRVTAVDMVFHHAVEAETPEEALELVKAGESEEYDSSAGETLDDGHVVQTTYEVIS